MKYSKRVKRAVKRIKKRFALKETWLYLDDKRRSKKSI